jgi:nucleoid-associated protein EbfC|nr:YbaB/EbfC family nucleoid-associated protein [Saprospiraceae bacterium]
MLGDLMNRIEGAKLEAQEKLKRMVISKSDLNGWVKVEVSGLRQILDISISKELIDKGEPELVEDVMTNVLNDAFTEAADREREVMEDVAKEVMPGGLGGLKGLFG